MGAPAPPAPVDRHLLEATLKDVDLVIFDFDGVIADSEVLSLGTLQEAMAEHGVHLTPTEVRQNFLGKSLASISDYVRDHGPEGAVDKVAHGWRARLHHRLRQELTPIDGITSFVTTLKKRGVAHCVASSSRFERMGLSLEAMGLTSQFPDLFSAQQVQNGKPAPDLFLFAAAQMNVAPGACLVIEDSPHGVIGAKAAGMRVFGFVDGAHLYDIEEEHRDVLLNAGADYVLRRYADVLPAPPHGGPDGGRPRT